MTAIENPKTYKWVGTRPIRHDGYDKVVGKARFAADLNLPGQLPRRTCGRRTPTPTSCRSIRRWPRRCLA